MISVIVPVYNVQEYLDRCINSIVNQSYKNIEVILVDDGSTDNSAKICDNWASRDLRIKVIHKNNGGLSSARNAGIDIADGDFFSFIDSDDYIDCSMLEVMLAAMERTNKDIACCGRYVDVWGKYVKQEFCLSRPKIYQTDESIKKLYYLNEIDVSACDKVYKKEVFSNIRYPEGKISEDAAIIFQILQNSNGVVHVGIPFYHYIYRADSISKELYNEKKHDIVNNLEKTIKFTKMYYPAFINDCMVYCTLSTGTILLEMSQNKEIIKKYKSHYEDYMRLFRPGFLRTMKSFQINWKLKIRFLAVKSNTSHIFIYIRNIYHWIKQRRV